MSEVILYDGEAVPVGTKAYWTLTCPYSMLEQFDLWWAWHYQFWTKKRTALGVAAEVAAAVAVCRRSAFERLLDSGQSLTGEFQLQTEISKIHARLAGP